MIHASEIDWDGLEIEPPHDDDEIVTLRPSCNVTFGAVRVVLKLEAAGCILRIDEQGRLRVGPKELVSAEDAELIRRWLDDVKSIVSYTPPEI